MNNSRCGGFRPGFIIASILLISVSAQAQVNPGDPGANVNIIGPTPDPSDIRDEGNKQQNEPSCSIRPGDADCIICGFNDYRTVDHPLIQDAWQGVAMSCDGAVTWTSRVAPGHAAHPAPIGTEFAADPRMMSLPGMAVFAFIGGNRDENSGVLAVQHWLENLREDGDYYEPGKFTYIADSGNSGRFIDKPDALLVVDPPNRQGTIRLSTVMENPELGTIERDFPTGTLYVAYAVFTGSSSVKVLVKESHDWGKTWTNQSQKLSEDQNLVSGISLTSVGNTPMAVWRRAGDNNDFDSIMYSYLKNNGKWSKGEVLADICSFDQVSFSSPTAVTFRTNDFPWLANDGKNFYVFYSDRNYDGEGDCSAGRPRIVMKYASNPADLADAQVVAIDDSDDGDPTTTEDAGGSFQFMPAAFGVLGNVQVAWYDTRREGLPGGPALIADYYDPIKGANVNRKVDVYTARVISDATGGNVQVSPPVRVSQFRIGARIENVDGEAQAGSVAIEGEASFANAKMYASGTLSFIGDYLAVAGQEVRLDDNGKVVSNSSALTNPLTDNADFFVAWTDNRDVRGNIFDPTSLDNTVPYAPPENPVGMTDNVVPATPDALADESTVVARATSVPGDVAADDLRSQSTEGIEDPFDPMPDACVALDPQDRTRNANIYGARIRDQVRLTAPTPTRPLTNLQRALPVILTNNNDVPESYRLRITNQPLDAPLLGRASFRQLPAVPPFDGPDLPPPTVIEDLTVPPKSAFARTVFLVSNLSDASTGVAVFRSACVDLNPGTYFEGDCPVVASITLSGEGPSGDLQQPNFQSPVCDGTDPDCTDDVLRAELHNPELINPELINPELINPELINPELINPELINPELINPELINPELINLGFANPELINPELINPELINPELINPELINPELINPELINSAVGEDLTWTDYTFIVKNTGNVTTALDADIALTGPAAGDVDSQIIAWTLYITPTSRDCEYLPQFERRVLATVNNPDDLLDVATIDSPFEGAISAVAAPGQNIFFTRRVFGTEEELANIDVSGFTAASQAANCSQTDRPPGNTDPYFCQLQLADARERILIDLSPPVFDVSNADPIPVPPIEADRPGGACIDLVSSGIVSATDDGGSVSISCTDSLGAQICTGTEPGQSIPVRTLVAPDPALVTCTATDEAGNETTVQFGIDVQDNKAPMFTSFPTSPLEVDADPATGTATVDFEQGVEATDFDGVDPDPMETCTAETGQMPGEPIPVGVTAIECTATDASGNFVQQSYNLQVNDVTAPQFVNIPLPDVSVASTSSAGATVDYGLPEATDASDASPTVSCAPPPGSVFPIGTTVVTCTASDDAGNSASASFDVTVSDAEPPVITVPAGGIDATLESSAGAIVDYSASVSVDDNVDPSPTLTCTPASGSLFPPLKTVVECTATDSSGNSSSASFEVRVGYASGFGITPTKTSMKAGSSNPLTWGWQDASGGTIDSSGDTQILSIYQCGGALVLTTAGDPGSSGFRVKSDLSWEFNFQADDVDGTPLLAGKYCAVVESSLTEQKLYSPPINVR